MSEIPGVSSVLNATFAIQSLPGTSKVIGIVANAAQGTALAKYVITSYAEAVGTFGEDTAHTAMASMLKVCFQNGRGLRVIAIPAAIPTDALTKATATDYENALAKLLEEEMPYFIICDSEDSGVHAKIKAHVTSANAENMERVAIIAGAKQTNVSTIVTAAEAVNSEGVIYLDNVPVADDGLTELPGYMLTAAFAAVAAREVAADPSLPLTGLELMGFGGVAVKRPLADLETLITGGVTPIIYEGGKVSILRAVTSRTEDGSGNTDLTWQEATTKFIADAIMQGIRAVYKTPAYQRARNSENKRSSIKTDAVTYLEAKKLDEWIDSYTEPEVIKDPTSPTRAIMSFSFNVGDPLNQIIINANMEV